LGGLVLSCQVLNPIVDPKRDPDLYTLELQVQKAWEGLGRKKVKSEKISKEEETGFSYFLIYQWLIDYSSKNDLESILNQKAFLSGPHREEVFVRNDSKQFGHYNPEFVRLLGNILDLPERNSIFRNNTQSTFITLFQETARTFYTVNRKLHSNPAFLKNETERYSNLIESGRLDPYYLERFVLFLHPDFTDSEEIESTNQFRIKETDFSYPTNIVKEAVGFWLRRKIDNTEPIFLENLIRLLQIYDNSFLQAERN
jgi:hypothetical protein